MRKVPPIGLDDFKAIRLDEEYLYVDKTAFISEFIRNKAHVTLITRPRRFGKSLNLSSLKYFFDINEKAENLKLFKSLKVTQDKKAMAEFASRPVIFLSFKDLKTATWEVCKKKIIELFAEFVTLFLDNKNLNLRPQDQEILQAISFAKYDFDNLSSSLKRITRIYSEYYGIKPLLLLDEYDIPIQAAFNFGFYEQALTFFRPFLSTTFKSNPYLWRGLVTGCIRISKESIFSDTNNFEVASINSESYKEYFGFLDSEVKHLLEEFSLSHKYKDLKYWYNGYNFSNTIIYNPWSIVNFLKQDGKLSCYWINSGDTTLINQLLARTEPLGKEQLQRLLDKESIIVPLKEEITFREVLSKASSLWNFLYKSGYLTTKKIIPATEEHGQLAELTIPNFEVAQIFRNLVSDWFDANREESGYEDGLLSELNSSLKNGQLEKFGYILKTLALKSFSFFDVSGEEPEKFYHGVILGIFVNFSNTWEIKSNREAGYGRVDLILTPKKKAHYGVVLEFKTLYPYEKDSLAESAKKALLQIKTKAYAKELTLNGVSRVLQIGASFKGKEIAVVGEVI